MAIVLVNVVYLILIVLCYSAVCLQIDSLCLETAVEFINDPERCHFNKRHVQTSLKYENFACQMKCDVEIENIEDKDNYLWEVYMTFGNAIFTYESICPTANKYNQVTMSLVCTKLNAVKVPIGGFCKHDNQCQGHDYSGVCKHGRCVCSAGYILYNLQCYEGDLPLNYTCSFSEQCAGSPSASCLGRNCSCIEGYTAANSTDCVQNKVPVGGYCKHDAQCREGDNSVECELERCVCRAGYVLIDFDCLEGNFALNQSCASIEQCAGSPYASCLGGRCSCLEGYTPENSTDCVQIQKISLPNSLHPQGSIVGALFGGLLIGVIFTTAAGAIIYRRSHNHFKNREENVFANDSYAKVDHQNDLQIAKTKDKTRELSPNSCLGETSVYSLSSGKPSDRQTQDTVYNHLHEQVKRDDADYYDHACAVPDYNGDMGDYSHLHQVKS